MATFAGVVVDDVEDDLDAGLVEGRHHLLELTHLGTRGTHRAVGGVRSEEPQGVVSPIVRQSPAHDEGFGDELLDGQQLNGSDADGLEVLDDGRVGQTGIGAAQMLGDEGMQPGVALGVGLVDDRLTDVSAVLDGLGRLGILDHHGERDRGRVVGRIRLVVGLRGVIHDRSVVVDPCRDGLGIWVEQQLGRVEPHTAIGIPRTVNSVAVALTGRDVRDLDRPDTMLVHGHVVVDL